MEEDPMTRFEAKFREELAALRADADLGRRVREMLASEDPPEGMLACGSAYSGGRGVGPVRDAFDWLRRELTGEESMLRTYPWGEVPNDVAEQAPGSLATGGATGEEPPTTEVLDLIQAIKDSLNQRSVPKESADV